MTVRAVLALVLVALLAACDDDEATPASISTAVAATQSPEVPSPGLQTAGGLAFTPGLELSVHAPTGEGGPWPVGGAAALGAHRAGRVPEQIAREGAVVFSAPFRTVDEGGRFPDTFAESACAVGHARAHAAAFGGDPERVTLVAHSSGAGLAAVVALAADLFPGDCDDAEGGLPDVFVGIAGVYDLATFRPTLVDEADQQRTLEAFFGGRREAFPEAWAGGDPLTHLGRNLGLTVVLVHGEDDEAVPWAQSQAFFELLGEAGYDAQLVVIGGEDHASILDDAEGGASVAELILAEGYPDRP